MTKRILKRKNKKIKKRRVNRKVKAINDEVKRLELLMQQRQLMTLGNYGGVGGAPSAPISAVSTNLATGDLKNALADQKDKLNTEIVQYNKRLADMEHKNADDLADIEQKHDADNAYIKHKQEIDNERIDNTLADNRRALQSGLLFVAHLGSRIYNDEVPRISTRSQTPQPIRTRTVNESPLILNYNTPVSVASLNPTSSVSSTHKPKININREIAKIMEPAPIQTPIASSSAPQRKISNIERHNIKQAEIKAAKIASQSATENADP